MANLTGTATTRARPVSKRQTVENQENKNPTKRKQPLQALQTTLQAAITVGLAALSIFRGDSNIIIIYGSLFK